MNILIACDKFKGSLNALEACKAIAQGLMSISNKHCRLHPMADGGDGSLAVLGRFLDHQSITINTTDPLGRPLDASYFIHQKTAYIELAAASGIALLAPLERNPLLTSSYGTGLLIKDALQRDIQHLVLFLGGSATNDAGLGIASALGLKFFSETMEQLRPIGKSLNHLSKIYRPIDLSEFDLEILYDVSNPMYGPQGAAQVYAAQKGANEAAILSLDQGLKKMASIVKEQFNIEIDQLPGAGSAGGIGGGLAGLLNARLVPGFQKIAAITQLEENIQWADLVITGEGQLDHQSLDGKVVGGIAELCLQYQKKLIAFVGNNSLSNHELSKTNISQVFSIMSKAESEADGMERAEVYLRDLAKACILGIG